MNDKIKQYMDDEGEFLIPFEQIQRGKRPRLRAVRRNYPWVYALLVLGAMSVGVFCGLAFVLVLVTA